MIESINNDKVKYWTKLNSKKFQELEKKFLVEGEHLVEEAYKAGYLLEVIALEEFDSMYPNTTFVSEAVMGKISSMKNINKVIGVVKYVDPKGIDGNVLLLDRIMDPGNLGTIIRSAVAFGIDTIVLGSGCVSLYNPKVVRATEGLMFHINIITADLERLLEELKDNGYQIFSTDVNGGEKVSEIEFNGLSAIIVGNEGAGVNPVLSEKADKKLYIETSDACESLNVGVATSIILYELSKK